MKKILMLSVMFGFCVSFTGCNVLNVEGDVGSNNDIKADVKSDVKIDSGAQVLSNNKIDSGAQVLSNNKIDSGAVVIKDNDVKVVIKELVFGVDYDIEMPAFGEWNKGIQEEEDGPGAGYFRPRPDTNLNYPRTLPTIPDGWFLFSRTARTIHTKDYGYTVEKAVCIKELGGTCVYLKDGEWYFLAAKNGAWEGKLIKWEKD